MSGKVQGDKCSWDYATTVNPKVKTYLESGYTSIEHLCEPFSEDVEDYSQPLPITFDWSDVLCGRSYKNYRFYLSDKDDFSNGITISTTETSVKIYNLFVNTKYFWKVVAGEWESGVRFIKTDLTAPRLIKIDGVTNVRDLGGYKVANGSYINQGLIYRASNVKKPSGVTAEGLFTAKKILGIKTEIDLRMETEGALPGDGAGKGCFKDGVYYRNCSMDWDYTQDTNSAAIQKLFAILSDKNNYPIIFHCTAGADRTGFIAYLIDGLLGVKKADLINDYQISNFAKQTERGRFWNTIAHGYVKVIDEMKGDNLSEKIFKYLVEVKGVNPEHLYRLISIMTESKTSFFDFYTSCEKRN